MSASEIMSHKTVSHKTVSHKTVSSHVSATGWFELYPLRFRFATCKLREFSPNTVRGAFGSALRRIEPDSYRRWFVPLAGGPSGLANPPRPFVFRLPSRLEIRLNLF